MELLAPAGNWESLLAAVSNGADSIYLGGQLFSARHSAENFSSEELKEALFYAHSQGKKLYLAVNTLLDKRELTAALQYIEEMYLEGIDAVIVQDLGLMSILREALPDLPVHASTQMTIHNAEGCQLLYGQGLRRVVLAREMAAGEIQLIKQKVPEMELEVFVHGALCYSYSGQCLFSSMVGQRSGNRGRCAQPCRMPYRLTTGGKKVMLPNQAGPYCLSLSDLCLIDHLETLTGIGVSALKIEGRMKRPEYVATVTRVYRQALDQVLANRPRPQSSAERGDLLKIFNRTFSTGYLFPERKGLLSPRRPNNRGVLVGRVLGQGPDRTASIKLSAPLREGDGIEVWVSRGKAPAVIVKNMLLQGKIVEKAGSGDVVDIQLNGLAAPGDRVFKTHDQDLIDKAWESFKQAGAVRIPVSVQVNARPGLPLEITYTDKDGCSIAVCSRSQAEIAEKHPLDKEVLVEKLGRLGQTPYYLQNLDFNASGPLTVPFRDLNEARREAVAGLIQMRKESFARRHPDRRQFKETVASILRQDVRIPKRNSTRLAVAVSGFEEARAALQAGAQRVYLGLEGLNRRHTPPPREVIDLVHFAGDMGRELVPALPRIQKPGELERWEGLARGQITLMAGNLGSVQWCLQKGVKFLADYSLNIFNPQSLAFILGLGAAGACLSPELDINRLQDFELGDNIEMLVHGDIQLMLSECCIFKQMLEGEKGGCRTFCQNDDICLEDERGYRFPVASDADCRLYIFNSRTLSLIENLERVVEMGIGWLRIEARRSSPEEVQRTTSVYRDVIGKLRAGRRVDLPEYKERLNLAPGSYTRGHFLRGVQ